MADEARENEQQEEQQEERTFTQAEVDALIDKRLARERKGMPTAEELFPFWKPDTHYEKPVRVRDPEDGLLYRLIPETHDSQADWPPRLVPAIWTEVAEPGQGDTPDNPIPYNNNMELIETKYYSQFDVVYRCIRSTGVPVYNNLADLVGIYVEVVS